MRKNKVSTLSLLWSFITGFSHKENWGKPEKMNGLLIILMEKVRHVYRERNDSSASFNINCGLQDRRGQHSKGNASDFWIKTKLSYVEQVKAIQTILLELQVSGSVGLGIYPDWNNPGFHLDVRGITARWGRIDNVRNEAVYGFTVPKDGYVSLDNALRYAEMKEAA